MECTSNYQNGHCPEVEFPGLTIVWRVELPRSVTSRSTRLFPPMMHEKCTITDEENWSCDDVGMEAGKLFGFYPNQRQVSRLYYYRKRVAQFFDCPSSSGAAMPCERDRTI